MSIDINTLLGIAFVVLFIRFAYQLAKLLCTSPKEMKSNEEKK